MKPSGGDNIVVSNVKLVNMFEEYALFHSHASHIRVALHALQSSQINSNNLFVCASDSTVILRNSKSVCKIPTSNS